MDYNEKIGRSLARDLAELTDLIGTNRFYQYLAKIFGKFIGNDRTLVSRYSRYDRPEIFVNNAVTDEIVRIYYGGLYRVDALYRLCRTVPKAGVLTVTGLDEGYLIQDWITGLLRMAGVSDELVILFPALGDITIVLSCVQHKSRFSPSIVREVEKLQPLLAALHEQHLQRTYAGFLAGDLQDLTYSEARGAAIFDAKGDCVFSDSEWQRHVESSSDYELIRRSILRLPKGSRLMGDQGVVHWEELRPSVPVLSACRIAFHERTSPGPTKVSPEEILALFRDIHDLTPREIDVVREVIAGCSNEQIATKLGISVGTVKNCRWRLYFKLDITTERELFSMLLAMMLEQSANKSTP